MKTVYSHHAQERISYRRLSLNDIEQTLKDPTQKITLKDQHFKFIKQINGRKYHIVAKEIPVQDIRLVISAWVRGEDDPESLFTTIVLAPFKLLWAISTFLWRKMRASRTKIRPPHQRR